MTKISYIVTAVLIILAGVFAILKRFWDGLAYFVLGTLLLLSIFWGVILIVRFFTEYKQELAEKFKYFKAEKVNKGQITSEAFEANLLAYQKEFNKKMLKEKLLKWCVIAFCFAVAAAFLTAMILYKV